MVPVYGITYFCGLLRNIVIPSSRSANKKLFSVWHHQGQQRRRSCVKKSCFFLLFRLTMGRYQEADPEKEKKRKKGLRKMGKILGKAWALPNAEPFHSTTGTGKESSILCLTDLGQKIDSENYRYGRHGWEDFARDIGGVYNRHIQR